MVSGVSWVASLDWSAAIVSRGSEMVTCADIVFEVCLKASERVCSVAVVCCRDDVVEAVTSCVCLEVAACMSLRKAGARIKVIAHGGFVSRKEGAMQQYSSINDLTLHERILKGLMRLWSFSHLSSCT